LWPWGVYFWFWPRGVSLCDLEVCLFECDFEASTVRTPWSTSCYYEIRRKICDNGASINSWLLIFLFPDFCIISIKTKYFGIRIEWQNCWFFISLRLQHRWEFNYSAIMCHVIGWWVTDFLLQRDVLETPDKNHKLKAAKRPWRTEFWKALLQKAWQLFSNLEIKLSEQEVTSHWKQ